MVNPIFEVKMPIVHSLETVALVGGGLTTNNAIRRCFSVSNTLVGVDRGAEICRSMGLNPNRIIGDLDSLKDVSAFDADTIHKFEEQDTTDFDKALRSIDAPLIVGAGFVDGRTDHYLACLNTLVTRPERRCVLLGAEDVVFVVPPKFTISLTPVTRVSLFPMAEVQGTSEGVKWPIDGLRLAPDGMIGTSNEATGAVTLKVDRPNLMMLLPADEFENVVDALKQCPATWPARAG